MRNAFANARYRISKALRYLPLIVWVAFFAVAFGWILLASFSTNREIFSNGLLHSGFHFENYLNVWQYNNVGRYFINSLLCTGIPCTLIILISAPAAYVLAKKRFSAKKPPLTPLSLA